MRLRENGEYAVTNKSPKKALSLVSRLGRGLHFLHGIGNKHCLKIIAIIQATRNTGGKGKNVFHYCRKLNSMHITINGMCVNVATTQQFGHFLSNSSIVCRNGKIRTPLQGNFLRMAWPCNYT
jgi:predicted membrane protein